MGDRSPKSTQKNASQKQAKNDSANHQKNALITSQQETRTTVVRRPDPGSSRRVVAKTHTAETRPG